MPNLSIGRLEKEITICIGKLIDELFLVIHNRKFITDILERSSLKIIVGMVTLDLRAELISNM